MYSVSEPIHRPVGVAYSANTAAPSGLRPGFQVNGRPLTGSSAARPGRATAPGCAWSTPSGVVFQRLCPPMYTAVLVTVVAHTVSPPVWSIQVGLALALVG